MKKVRDINIDILKGIGMLLVIIGHSGCIWPFYPAINAFHMPLFFIVSGLFFSTKMTILGGGKIRTKKAYSKLYWHMPDYDRKPISFRRAF